MALHTLHPPTLPAGDRTPAPTGTGRAPGLEAAPLALALRRDWIRWQAGITEALKRDLARKQSISREDERLLLARRDAYLGAVLVHDPREEPWWWIARAFLAPTDDWTADVPADRLVVLCDECGRLTLFGECDLCGEEAAVICLACRVPALQPVTCPVDAEAPSGQRRAA